MTGKFGISASFAIIYNFTAELYPTNIRNIGVGAGSFWARIGGILAPFISQLVRKLHRVYIMYGEAVTVQCAQRKPRNDLREREREREEKEEEEEEEEEIVAYTMFRLTLKVLYLQSDVDPSMPSIIFGTFSVAAGLLALLLPETKGKSLPETLEDGENFGRWD